MTDTTTAFFENLMKRGHEPLLKGAIGSVRIDLADGKRTDHWLVSIDRGDVVVTRENRDAQAVLRTDRRTFDGIASGRVNTLAGLLRGVAEIGGDPELVIRFCRLFPAPPGSHGPKPPTAGGSAS